MDFCFKDETGARRYLEVGGMLKFVNDAAAEFARTATA